MTTNRWYLCADASMASDVAAALMAHDDKAEVICVPSAQGLRRALLGECPGMASALVGEGCEGMDPINLAAAVAADAHAAQVVLACPNPSGSLRSRAARAGVGLVVDLQERTSPVPPKTDINQRAGGCRPANPPMAGTGERGDAAAVGVRRGADAAAKAVREALPSLDDLDEPDGIAGGLSAEGSGHPVEDARRPQTGAAESSSAAMARPSKGRHAPMLAFVSGRGGVGKTAIVATSALVAASWGMRVAVVDLDLAFGNLFGVLGMSGPADLSPLSGAAPGAAQAEAIVRCGRKVCERVALWGPCEHAELAETVQPHAATLLSVLSSRYDLVLVDTSTTWGDAIAQAVQTCDRLVIVGDQRAGAVSSLARAGNLAVRLGVARTRIMRLMNRCDPRHRDEGFLARADVGLECARNLRVVDGGDEVAELLSAGLAQELSVLECDFTDSLSTALAQTLSELGCLPDDPRAARALEGRRRLSRGLFGRGREAS